jgi:hypothetical protein
MESRFGRDFGHVRIHTGPMAAALASALAARAYTVGRHIVFNAGRYAPDTLDGRRLLAHELAHVAQQEMSPSHQAMGRNPESDAARAADAVGNGGAASIRAAATPGSVQRAPEDEEDVRVISDPAKGKVRVIRVDKKGRVIGLAELTPPRAEVAQTGRVSAYRERGRSGKAQYTVAMPEAWKGTTNPAAKVSLEASEEVTLPPDVIGSGSEEDQFNTDDAVLKFVEERYPEMLSLVQFPASLDLNAFRNMDEFTKWKQVQVAKLHQAEIAREDRYYQAMIYRQTGLMLSPQEAREYWERYNRPSPTKFEQEHIAAGTLPAEIRDEKDGTLIGYRRFEYRKEALGGGVGTVIEITLDREGKEVHRQETTVLTPATEFFQDVARNAPISGTLINAAEVGGLSLDVRDPGRFLSEGERLDRLANAAPFVDPIRTATEVVSGVSLTDKDLDKVLKGEARVLSERERRGKAAVLGLQVAGEAIGANVRIKPKVKARVLAPPPPPTNKTPGAHTPTSPPRPDPSPARPQSAAPPPKGGAPPVKQPPPPLPRKTRPAESRQKLPGQGEAPSAEATGTGPKTPPEPPVEQPKAHAVGESETSAKARRRTSQQVSADDARRKIAQRKAAERAAADARKERELAQAEAVATRKDAERLRAKADRKEQAAKRPGLDPKKQRSARKAARDARAAANKAARRAAAADRRRATAIRKEGKANRQAATLRETATAARQRSGKEVPRTTLFSVGRKGRKELIAFWEGKIKRARSETRKQQYREYIRRIQKGERPTPKQSEMEAAYWYREMSPSVERGFKHGSQATWKWREGKLVPQKGSTRPDFTVTSAMVEIKNYRIENTSGLIAKLKRQVAMRAEHGPANVKQQAIILDLRGQKAKLKDINRLTDRVARETGVPLENIQVISW